MRRAAVPCPTAFDNRHRQRRSGTTLKSTPGSEPLTRGNHPFNLGERLMNTIPMARSAALALLAALSLAACVIRTTTDTSKTPNTTTSTPARTPADSTATKTPTITATADTNTATTPSTTTTDPATAVSTAMGATGYSVTGTDNSTPSSNDS